MNKQILLIIALSVLILPLLWIYDDFFLFRLFNYIDELLAVIGLIFIIKKWGHLSGNEKHIFKLMICLVFVGLIGTLVNKIQTDYFPIALDAFQCVKCFVVFIYANHIVNELDDKSKIYIIERINIFLIPFIIVAFGFAILNIVSDIGMHNTVRHGLRAFMFVCKKSGTFSDLFFYYIIFLTTGYKISSKKRLFVFIIILTLITWMLTLRTRSIVYAPIFFIMFYWVLIKSKPLNINISSLFVVAMIALALGSEKIETTYADEEAGPRAILFYYGYKTMVEHMPIGAGLGTYGTDVAAKYYSPLYYDYGINNYWGMGPDDGMFLHDNYWPAIMGEYGIIGCFIVGFILVFIGIEIYKKYRNNSTASVVTLFLYLTLILNSTATPAFFISNTIYLFLLMPLSNLEYLNDDSMSADNE